MFDQENIRKLPVSKSSRCGGTTGIVLTLLIVVGIIGGVSYWRIQHSKAAKQVNLIFATVERGTFIHEVNGKGSAESAKNVDVASQVEGSATVIYLIPEGSDVKKGELLVELDSSDVDEKLDSQVVTTNSSRATLNSSRATLRSAEISLEEYVEGTFEQSWMEYESSIFDAEQTRKQKADITRFTERLLNLDYSTELQYEIDKVAEENAKNTLEVTNLKKMTLLKYTSEKEITSLMSDIETARAKVDSDKNSYNINLSRENRYRAQSANCKIKAPQDGQVVYANQDSRRMSESDMIKEGSTVRQRQVLIRLPDKSQMQVKTMINESNISSVKVGMPAKISFDSMPNRIVKGVVTKVSLYPEMVWMSSAKDYVTLVKIEEDIPELRSGLTAQVRIVADEQENVLMVPVQCVTEYGKKNYCITYDNGVWGYKEVLLGESNEKQVIILDGLSEGEHVVSGARLYRDKVEFPDVDAPSLFENSEIYQRQVAEREEEIKQKEIETNAGNNGEMLGGSAIGGGTVPNGGPRGGGASAPMPTGPGGIDPSASLMSRMIKEMGKVENNDDIEEKNRKQEEAFEYNKTIVAKLQHDSKVAAIQPFFGRTVMEMQRELLSAISEKTSKLQARIAARQNEISRRQDEIELLKKTKTVDGKDTGSDESVEGASEKIERLQEEISVLRGDVEQDPMEHVTYLDKIDWTKFVSGNDITQEGLNFLFKDSDSIFDEMFPNSKPLGIAVETTGENALKDSGKVSDESLNLNVLKKEEDSKYGVFSPLFESWDTNSDGVLKPTEFVIGFFTDRKSFQDSETDDSIDKLFAEYCQGNDDNVEEIALEEVKVVADRILCERQEGNSSNSLRENRRGKAGNFGMPPRRDGRLNDSEFTHEGVGSQNGMPDIRDENKPSDFDIPPVGHNDDRESVGNFVENENMRENIPEIMEPIKSLDEASSLRQAIAFYVLYMDFNEDGILQKHEFVKGCNDVNDVAGKMFTSTSLINSIDSGAPMMGPPPR